MGLDSGDRALIQIVDAALAEAARKSGQWLVCRVGCTQCCVGPFPISQLDARRLRGGLAELEARDPERGALVRQRARQSVARISSSFPGDPATGRLAETEEAEEEFASFADDEPSVRCGSDAVGVCELCFVGATDDEIAACEVEADVEGLESTLLEELEKTAGARGQTIVAFALVS